MSGLNPAHPRKLICDVKGHDWAEESHNEHTCVTCQEVVVHKNSECDFCPEGETCTCDRGAYGEHSCPFAADVHNDSESLCDCCPYCEQQCADDI